MIRAAYPIRSLGQLIDIKHGYAFDGAHFVEDGRYILLTPGNFAEEGGFKGRGDKQKHYNGPVPPDFILKPRDLIVAMTEQGEGLLGSSAHVPEGKPCLHNQRLGLVSARTDAPVDLGFVYYLFNSRSVRQQIRASASGAKVRHTSPSRIYAVQAPIPPVSVQRRIASILGAYDDLIQVNRRRIAILEEIGRRLFEEWFVRFRFPGHENCPMVDGPDGPLPKGWVWRPLSALASLVGESTSPVSSPDQSFLHYSFTAFDTGAVPALEAGSSILSNKLRFRGPVVLVGKLNPRLPRVWYVPAAETTPQIASTEFLPLRAIPPLGGAGLLAYLQGAPFLNRLKSLAQGTSTSHQRVRPADVLAIRLATPPLGLLALLDRHVAPIFGMTKGLREVNQRLAAARDLLLPRLVSGELSVAAAERELEAVA